MDSQPGVLLCSNGERIDGAINLRPYGNAFAGTFRPADRSSTSCVNPEEDALVLQLHDGRVLFITGVMLGNDGTLFFLPRESTGK